MITIEMVMLAALGFLTAALLALFIAPLYRRRVARLTTEMLKRSMPLTEAEIRADKDRLRAEAAIRIHKLETKAEEAAEASARQMVELNRRDAVISELEGDVARQGTALEEHENARRVLEQTIMDRLPKVEHRLAEARKLLFQRDREIVSLTQSSEKQQRALEEVTQINTQQTDEVHRLKAALNTRASRNREGFGDARYDGEVALRTEIEALRAKTRDQTALIARLQSLVARAGPAAEATDAGGINGSGDAMRPAKVVGKSQVSRRRPAAAAGSRQGVRGSRSADASRDPPPQVGQSGSGGRAVAAQGGAHHLRGRRPGRSRRQREQDRHEGAAFRADGADRRAVRDHSGAARRARGRQREARAAGGLLHGRDAPPRLRHVPASGPARRSGAPAAEAAKRPLAERINDPRVARLVRQEGEERIGRR